MTRFENVGVFIREKVWLMLFSSQTVSRKNTPTFSNLFILHTYPPMKMEQTECSETSAYKIGLARAIFEPNLFPYKYSIILKPSYSSYLSAYEDGTDRVFRNVGV
jgi:hypothetical protein